MKRFYTVLIALTLAVITDSVFAHFHPGVLSSFRVEKLDKEAISSRSILLNMLQAIDNLKTMKYTFKAKERFEDGETIYTELDVKLNVKPFKVYADTKSEINNGVEVLYVEGERDGKALVNPNKWYLPNVNLDPYGKQMRKDQHNTVLQSGFGMLRQIIQDAINRADKDAPELFEDVFNYAQDVTWEGRECYQLVIQDPEFRYIDYTVKDGEDINKISHQRDISGYLIIEKNDNVDGFNDVKPGMKIKIPTSYAKKTILYIDKSNWLPVVQIMFDEKGQFERYEFDDLQVNPEIKPVEFTPDYEDYRF